MDRPHTNRTVSVQQKRLQIFLVSEGRKQAAENAQEEGGNKCIQPQKLCLQRPQQGKSMKADKEVIRLDV